MKANYIKFIVGFVLLLIAIPIVREIYGIHGMFEPHSYNWGTGMPGLSDQVSQFQHVNKRWPTNYNDLVGFMTQTTSNFVAVSYDRIDFTPKLGGNLEVVVYAAEAGITNKITNFEFKPKK